MMEFKPLQVLLIDDSEDDAMLLKELFREARYLNIVDAIADGDEALNYLHKRGRYAKVETPGLILLDINMPGKDGFSVLHEIKSDPVLKSIPVVMLTTSARDE